MRLTDYMPMGECPVCGKIVYSTTSWSSTKYRNPRILTCSHDFDPYHIQDSFKGVRDAMFARLLAKAERR